MQRELEARNTDALPTKFMI